jgi:hypothetical protein
VKGKGSLTSITRVMELCCIQFRAFTWKPFGPTFYTWEQLQQLAGSKLNLPGWWHHAKHFRTSLYPPDDALIEQNINIFFFKYFYWFVPSTNYLLQVQSGTINEYIMAWGREGRSHPSATLPIVYITHNRSRGHWRFKRREGWRGWLGEERVYTRWMGSSNERIEIWIWLGQQWKGY